MRKRSRNPGEPRKQQASMDRSDGVRFGNILRDTVRDQIKANDPPEVASTLRRLLASGIDEAQAIELITAVIAAEMFHMMTQGREFDPRRYLEDLRRLPELPYDSDA